MILAFISLINIIVERPTYKKYDSAVSHIILIAILQHVQLVIPQFEIISEPLKKLISSSHVCMIPRKSGRRLMKIIIDTINVVIKSATSGDTESTAKAIMTAMMTERLRKVSANTCYIST